MNKADLLKAVRQHLSAHPGDSSDLLQAVSEGLKDYERAVQTTRSRQATQAVLVLMGMASKAGPEWTIPFLIDPVFHQFPEGVRGHASCEVEFWNRFLDVARKEPLDREWLGGVKGLEYILWWDRVVAPALEKA